MESPRGRRRNARPEMLVEEGGEFVVVTVMIVLGVVVAGAELGRHCEYHSFNFIQLAPVAQVI